MSESLILTWDTLIQQVEELAGPLVAEVLRLHGDRHVVEQAIRQLRERAGLLQRDVWLATWPVGHCDGHSAEFAAFSSEDKLLDWMERTGHLCHPEATGKYAIDAEVSHESES